MSSSDWSPSASPVLPGTPLKARQAPTPMGPPSMSLSTTRTLPSTLNLETYNAEDEKRQEFERLKAQNQKLWSIIDKAYVRSACETAGLLDKRMAAIFEAMQRADLSSVLFTSTPFASAMSKFPFQLLVLVCSLWFLGSIVFHSYHLVRMNWTSTSRLFIFVPKELRDGTGQSLISEPGIQNFGLLRHGCKVNMHDSYTTIQGHRMIVLFKEPIKIDGWYFVTKEDSPETDPTHFKLLASVEQEGSNGSLSSSAKSSSESTTPSPTASPSSTDVTLVRTTPSPSVSEPSSMDQMMAMSNSTVLEDGMGSTMVNHSVFQNDVVQSWGWSTNLHEGGHWKQVGASAVAFDFYSNAIFLNERAEIPTERGVEVHYDMRPKWDSYVNGPVRHCICFILFFCTALLAMKGHSKLSRWPFIAVFFILFALCIPIASVYVSRGLQRISSIWWAEAVGNLILPFTLLYREEKLASAMLLYGFYYLGVMPFVVVGVARFSFVDGLWICVPGALVALAATVFQVARRHQLKRSQQLIGPDKRLYDETWSCMLTEDYDGELLNLQSLADEIQVARDSTYSRQFQRKTQTSEFNRGSSRRLSSFSVSCDHGGVGIPDTIDVDRPVISLDQLYAQATAMDLVLKQKVTEWARDGFFPTVKQAPGSPALSATSDGANNNVLASIVTENSFGRPTTPVFVKWEAAERDDSLRNSIKWATVKSTERAIEKAVRTYGNDVSRLLDVVRQSIVFSSVSHITTALRGILQDPGVRIVRVKNRLDPRYDSWTTAGYRDLVVNLRVVNDETLRLGVETHVCELQLIHVRFAEMKHDEGHKRYVQFRNLRGM